MSRRSVTLIIQCSHCKKGFKNTRTLDKHSLACHGEEESNFEFSTTANGVVSTISLPMPELQKEREHPKYWLRLLAEKVRAALNPYLPGEHIKVHLISSQYSRFILQFAGLIF